MSATGTPLRVDFPRLRSDIETLSRIGRDGEKGLFRMAFGDGDMAARAWLMQRIRDAGLDLYVDGAANIHARLGWDGRTASVIAGSHIDSVPGGGHLDGALGVLVAIECLRRFAELKTALARPVEAVAFTDEEGRFGSTLGSEAMTGVLTGEAIEQARDAQGLRLIDAMAAHGLNARAAREAKRPPQSIHACLELHIEQGPVLDSRGIRIGVVEAIVGRATWSVTLAGAANHAGTTPMGMRRDAFQGLCEFAIGVEAVLREAGGAHSVATIGQVKLVPGAANVVPGQVEFSLDMRDGDDAVLAALTARFRAVLLEIAERRGLRCAVDEKSPLQAARCHPLVMDAVTASARELGVEYLRMPSGAVHDTQLLARIAPAGMVFIPSRGGISHSAEEWSSWEDIELGANVTLNAIHRLARE